MTLLEKDRLGRALEEARNAVITKGTELYRFADERECFRQCREHSPELVETYRIAHAAYMAA